MKYNKCHENQEANISRVIFTKTMFEVLYLQSALFGVLNMQFSQCLARTITSHSPTRIDEHRGRRGGAHRLSLLPFYPYYSTTVCILHTVNQSEKGKMQDGRQAKGVQTVTIHCLVTRLIFKL